MTGEECKKVSKINEHIPKRQAKSDNKAKECVNLRKKKVSKVLGRKCAKLNE